MQQYEFRRGQKVRLRQDIVDNGYTYPSFNGHIHVMTDEVKQFWIDHKNTAVIDEPFDHYQGIRRYNIVGYPRFFCIRGDCLVPADLIPDITLDDDILLYMLAEE